jgi:hypothetical protein
MDADCAVLAETCKASEQIYQVTIIEIASAIVWLILCAMVTKS